MIAATAATSSSPSNLIGDLLSESKDDELKRALSKLLLLTSVYLTL